MITISLCMIVKNEEAVLARGLDTIVDLMDEIIIVDTGSTDRTKEIAARYTTHIYDFVWKDDFAAARNFSFSKATMEYIYCADADEIIDKENRKKFLQIKQILLPEIDIVQMKYCNQLQFGTTYNFDVEYRPKLYKRLRKFIWIDAIHETVIMEPVVFDSDIEIIHMPTTSHGERDFQTFQKLYKKGIKLSDKLHYLYARELFIAGKEQDFLDAQELFEQTLIDETSSIDRIKEATCVIAKASHMKKDYLNFYKNAVKNIACDGCAEMCYELGEYYFLIEDYLEAVIWYYNAAYETECILNVHYGGDLPLKRLAQCYNKLGKEDKAKEFEKLSIEWKCE